MHKLTTSILTISLALLLIFGVNIGLGAKESSGPLTIPIEDVDNLGAITLWYLDGTTLKPVDATWSAEFNNLVLTGSCTGCDGESKWTQISGAIYLSTTTDQVLIGNNATNTIAKLEVWGDVSADNYTATSTATSTLPQLDVTDIQVANGIDISGDFITDFAGTNLTVTAGVLNAAAGGSTFHVDGGGFVYPQTGDFHSAPHYVATSTTATSTFAGGLTVQTTALVVQDDSGNVGIGVANPNRLLHVENNSADVIDNSNLKLINLGAGDAYAEFAVTAQDWAIGIDNSDSDFFKIVASNDVSDGTDDFVFDLSGGLTATTFIGALTGNADTVTTNANLTGHITSTGNAAVLGSFTSSNLSTALTDETGSGVAVFATSPTFTTALTVTGGGTIDADGIDLVTGNDYEINGTSVLSNNTLGSGITTSSLNTVATLNSGTISTGFGTIDNGSSNITSGGRWRLDVDGTGINAAGSFNFGAAVTDSAIYWNGTNLEIDTTTATEFSISGTTEADIAADGFNIITGDSYQINNTSVLNATTLGGAVVNSSLTGLGTVTSGTISAGVYGAASIDGDDINSNIAGRSLTLTSASPDTLDVDAELFTYNIGTNLFATTTADGISTTTEAFLSVQIANASTITGFSCYADDTGTSTIRAAVSTTGTGAGTDILYTTGVECGSDVEVATTTFSSTSIGADDWIHFYVSDAEPTGSRPRVIYTSFKATKDD